MSIFDKKLTSTDSTKSLDESMKEDAYRRHTIDAERRAEIQEKIKNPQITSPAAKALLQNKENEALSQFPEISHEDIVDRSLIDPAPDEWNFFGKPDAESYNLLMNSIISFGLLNPITLWKRPGNRYMILSGHTRESVFDELAQATGDSKWLSIPAKIYDEDALTENEARRIIILANVAQRAKETPRVRIRCYSEYARLTKAAAPYGSGIDVSAVVAKVFNISRSTVFLYMRLQNLIDPLLDRFCDNILTISQARILSGLPTELQKHLVKQIDVSELTEIQYEALKKAESVEDIDKIIYTPEELKSKKKKHSYSVSLPIQRPKDSDIIGICVPKKEAEECRRVILEALKNASLSDETRELLQLQFQNSSLTM